MELGTSTRAAARAAAAAQQLKDAAAVQLALGVCLQQPCFRQPDGHMVMTLLRVAKWLRALVARCCGGTLVLRTKVHTPEAAQSLAAWLARHGALLDELELHLQGFYWRSAADTAQHGQQQHPAARVMGQVPCSLRHLALSGSVDHTSGAQQAAALAAAFRRQPMQLRSLELRDGWSARLGILLPALASLSSLVIELPYGAGQHLHIQHLPAQLQQLELTQRDTRSLTLLASDLPWLALGHVTGLTSLRMLHRHLDGGVLPRGLRALEVAGVSDVAPVLRLQQLTALQLGQCSMSAAEQLRQLSTLRQLEQLSVSFASNRLSAALGVLPLTHLAASVPQLTAACMEHLGACTRLTRLCLGGGLAPGATHEQLAAALARLVALEDLELMCGRWPPAPLAQLCGLLVGLPRLLACELSRVGCGPEAVQLTAVTQLTRLGVASCELDDADVLSLCSGLRGLQSFNLRSNYRLTDACLAGAAALSLLTWLDVGDTHVTLEGVQQLQTLRPQLLRVYRF